MLNSRLKRNGYMLRMQLGHNERMVRNGLGYSDRIIRMALLGRSSDVAETVIRAQLERTGGK